MNEIVLHRGLAGRGVYLSVGQREQRNPCEGRQGKSTDQGRVHVVDWIEHFGHWFLGSCQRFFRNSSNFNAPGAVTCDHKAEFAHGHPR